jgi:hypothetical protein
MRAPPKLAKRQRAATVTKPDPWTEARTPGAGSERANIGMQKRVCSAPPICLRVRAAQNSQGWSLSARGARAELPADPNPRHRCPGARPWALPRAPRGRIVALGGREGEGDASTSRQGPPAGRGSAAAAAGRRFPAVSSVGRGLAARASARGLSQRWLGCAGRGRPRVRRTWGGAISWPARGQGRPPGQAYHWVRGRRGPSGVQQVGAGHKGVTALGRRGPRPSHIKWWGPGACGGTAARRGAWRGPPLAGRSQAHGGPQPQKVKGLRLSSSSKCFEGGC